MAISLHLTNSLLHNGNMSNQNEPLNHNTRAVNGPRTILHLRSTGGLLGAENMLLQLVGASDPARYAHVIGVLHDSRDPYPELARAAEAKGFRVRIFSCHSRLDIQAIREIRKGAQSLDASVIHCHGYREDLYGWLSAIGRDHALIGTNHNWITSSRMLRIYARLDAFVLRRFDHVVAVSLAILLELKAAGIPKEKCSVIPNGIAVGAFSSNPGVKNQERLRKEVGLTFENVTIGIIASLTPEKGHHFLLEAIAPLMREFPSTRLLIVGDGPLRPRLETEARALGIFNNTIFTGMRLDIAELLALIDISVLPSIREGLPMALLEAMAAGKPLVASSVGEIPRVLSDGDSGLLVPPGDALAVETALKKLLTSPDLRKRLGMRAFETVTDKYSARAMASAYMALYDQVLAARD